MTVISLPDTDVTMTVAGRAVATAETLAVDDPATGGIIAHAPVCDAALLDEAMAAAVTAQPAWARDDAAIRAALLAAGKAVASMSARLGALVTAEQGKPIAMAIGEAYSAAAVLRAHAGMELPMEQLGDGRRARVELTRRPHGVVAAVTPWNFPVAIAAAKIAPALRAGNAVVVKPSPHTPLATLLLGAILREVLPPGVLTVLNGPDELGAALVAHEATSHVSFTGSVSAGRHVAAAAGAGLRSATLELGGNDPAIVLDDVDPAAIADTMFWEAFANNGQACMAVKRLYVPADRYAAMVAALAARAESVRVGDGRVKGTELGPVTTPEQLDRVADLVSSAVAAGARVAAGGRRLDGAGRFHAPTVLADVRAGMVVVDEEQFGPVLPVLPYTDLDEAIAAANSTSYGLGASVWGADIDRAHEIAGRLEAGTVWVNGHAELGPDQPYAGLKHSGLGVEGGTEGLHGYTAPRVVRRPR
ncbi:aldehyde dehydrogenase family protein [Actinokineospora enzanensis]|uniref:aldehyde dehydrogenase family protein n=1 Tax=Actinokineospora enzanensis TaxID=155975 RepID=UPI00035E7125|nr:aldehyde dehydrogenase family protein [Actinokineospora enzanensis]